MRRIAAFIAFASLLAACSGKDRYLPEFGAEEKLATTNGPVVFTVAPNGHVFYAELRTNDIYEVNGEAATLVTHLGYKPDSLAVNSRGQLFAAGRDKLHRPWVTRVAQPGERFSGNGPPSKFPVHIAFNGDNQLLIGHGDKLVSRVNGNDTLISKDWTDPVITPGRGDRIWVADNALPGKDERVARGREQSVSKRNRFSSTLPSYTNPSGIVRLDDQLLLCSRTHKKVYRLHIGIEDVARRRGWMKGLVCDRDIAVDRQGALYTAANAAIYRYPPR